MNSEQARFEAWVKVVLPSASLNYGDHYLNSLVEMAWRGWQAALASHAPSEDTICPQCGWDTLTRSWQHAPKASEAAAQPTQAEIDHNRLEAILRAWKATDLSFKSDLCDRYRELHNALSDDPPCRNPNHALVDGSPSAHDIGPSCMAEIEHDH